MNGTSESVRGPKEAPYGSREDLKIQPKRPMVYVKQVVLNALLQLHERFRLTAPPVDLRPSGHAWFDPVPERIVVDRFVVAHIGRFRRKRMGSRPDQGHLAAQDIEDLRKLIKAGSTKKPADACDPRVFP
jgi:hypothetical protein